MKYIKPKNISGYTPKFTSIPLIKKRQYYIVDGYTIAGDQPKKFVRIYDYPLILQKYQPKRKSIATIKASKKQDWNLYIVKSAEKWYPNETITEYLLNCLGQHLGLKMSESFIARIGHNNQIRFLSKYFLPAKTSLLFHGADLYKKYLEDEQFVDSVEYARMSQDFFTVQFTKEVLEHFFPMEAKSIFKDFVKMLLFDVYVGNSDRHFYNWGIINSFTGKHKPYFSPIYDTARGLWWNAPESKVKRMFENVTGSKASIEKYIKKSKPKIGWENENNLNHFGLVKLLTQNNRFISKQEVGAIFNQNNFVKCIELINNNFSALMSKERLFIVKYCLELRHQHFLAAIKD